MTPRATSHILALHWLANFFRCLRLLWSLTHVNYMALCRGMVNAWCLQFTTSKLQLH